METQVTGRCPHFQLHSEPLTQEGPPAYLAIRHCLLTERMLRLLEVSVEAVPLTQRLVMRTERGTYAFVGPDLDAVTQQLCMQRRCDQQCTPAYRQMLRQFNVTDLREEEVTCHDEAKAVERESMLHAEAPSSTS